MIFSDKVNPLFKVGSETTTRKMDDPDFIKLSIGNPPEDGFPTERIRAVSERLLREDSASFLNYSTVGGRADSKEIIKKFLNRRGNIVRDDDTITITGGGQQAIALAVQLFCNDGDIVLCEAPTFMVALDSIKSEGGVPLGVKMDEDGINLEDLEAKMQMTPKPKLLYIISDFQNPMGVSLPEYKRKAICELAYKYDVPVIEDNPYYELRFEGDFLPFVKHYDEHGMVALTSSMSKIIAPGMRIGYVVASGKMGEGYALLKGAVDFHSSTWAERICCALLDEGIDDELEALRQMYGHRGRLMADCLGKYCHPSVKFTHPQGGMFIWVTLPDGISSDKFVGELFENKVVVVRGTDFYPNGGGDSSFRLSYSLASDAQIERGCKIIGDLTHKYCK